MANEELKKRVYVRQFKQALDLTQITGDDSSLDRWIIAPDINRPGLELSGYLESNDLKRVVILGNKEYEYMSKLPKDVQKQRFEIITDSYTPCIVLSEGFKENDVLIELARHRNFPIFKYEGKTYQLIVYVVAYLSEHLSVTDCAYGVMMNIYGKGVLIIGKSGIGKSELALDLIRRGHMLVADDRVDYTRINKRVICRAPDSLSKMLEIRGMGVVDFTRLFGAHTYLNKSDLNFVIKLTSFSEMSNIDRLNPASDTADFMGLKIPMMTIPITEGKSMSVIVEAAVTNYILKGQGIDLNQQFKDRILGEIKKNGEMND